MLLVVYSSLITGSTYAYLYFESNSNGISGSGKCEGINYKGENISASNLVSTTNYLEGAKSTITLSKNKDCTIYTYVNLYLYTNNTTTAPITTVKALKYKIVSSNNVTYSGVVPYMGDTLLATLPLEDKEVTYTIYLYIDSTLSLGNYNDKTYSGYIYATTEQTSTIGKSEDNSKKNLGLQTIDFDYLGNEQQFIVPQTGTYKLETWGAQGGSHSSSKHGGYGGYSVGNTILSKNNEIFLNIGGVGKVNNSDPYILTEGGYNGGGATYSSATELATYGSSGGGATSISKISGLLSSLESKKESIIIVSGAGGGSNLDNSNGLTTGVGGDGGGYIGNNGTFSVSNQILNDVYAGGGTQDSGGMGAKLTSFSGENGLFGIGGKSSENSGGGGGGYFGGGGGVRNSDDSSGGGGSGYIGNSQLTNKVMYCYNCEESTEESTKTISTTNVSETPISKYAKKGNGYARITIKNE